MSISTCLTSRWRRAARSICASRLPAFCDIQAPAAAKLQPVALQRAIAARYSLIAGKPLFSLTFQRLKASYAQPCLTRACEPVEVLAVAEAPGCPHTLDFNPQHDLNPRPSRRTLADCGLIRDQPRAPRPRPPWWSPNWATARRAGAASACPMRRYGESLDSVAARSSRPCAPRLAAGLDRTGPAEGDAAGGRPQRARLRVLGPGGQARRPAGARAGRPARPAPAYHRLYDLARRACGHGASRRPGGQPRAAEDQARRPTAIPSASRRCAPPRRTRR